MKSMRKKIKAVLGGGAILLLVFTFVSQATAQTWTELFPTGGPPEKRISHSAVYDPNTNRMIMFGGVPYHISGMPPLYNDVWVLSNADGAEASDPTWTELTTTGGPPSPRGVHSAVYDPNNNRMIVFGGDPSIGSCRNRTNDVWVLENANGLGGTQNWLELTTTGGPPGVRGLHSAVYDPDTNRMIMFGGNNACEPAMNDVWVLEHANGLDAVGNSVTPNWIPLTPDGEAPIALPGSSAGHSAVYDQVNNRMIVFIGLWCCANDVYVLENANGLGGTPTWIPLSPSGTPPSARAHQTAVYDPGSNRMILFGGLSGSPNRVTNDVWVLSNANGLGGDPPNWFQLSPEGRPPVVRDGHTAIYNPAANRMTVFGGRYFDFDNNVGYGLNDVWVLTDINGNDLSVDITRIIYFDNADRSVDYDFSDGVMDANGNVKLPDSAFNYPPEPDVEFWWYNWSSIGHSKLDTDTGLFSISVPQVEDYSSDWHIGVYDLEPDPPYSGSIATECEWTVSVDSLNNADVIQHQYLLTLTISSRWLYYDEDELYPKYSAYVQLYFFTEKTNSGNWLNKALLGRISIRNKIDGGHRWQTDWKFIGEGIDPSNTKIDVSLNVLSENEISAFLKLGNDPEIKLGSLKVDEADIRPMSGVWPSVVIETGYRSNQPPVADAGDDQTVILGEEATFDGHDSYDPDGTIVSYDWDFDDGNLGSGETTTHVYASVGTYTVTLTVEDDNKATDTDSLTVTVQTPEDASVSVIEELQSIVYENEGTDLGDKVEDVQTKAETALEELEKTPPDNQAAVGNIEGAVGDLEAALDKGLDPVEGEELMNQLARIARAIAAEALNKAIAQGGDPQEISEAQQYLAEGDALKESGAYKDAVNKYKDALAKAESSY